MQVVGQMASIANDFERKKSGDTRGYAQLSGEAEGRPRSWADVHPVGGMLEVVGRPSRLAGDQMYSSPCVPPAAALIPGATFIPVLVTLAPGLVLTKIVF